MNTPAILHANEHKSDSGFISQAQYLKDNWSWLKYSYAAAIKVKRRMKELSITQKELAGKLECTQQHVSVLLGGKANMTLETLAKLEQALSFDLIGHNLLVFGRSCPYEDTVGYLNDFELGGPIPEGVKTSKLVDGYKPRKKKGPKSSKITLRPVSR
ncbi:MAG: helix-turn-helix transcriptional regulator [Bacteroidales bacterium]|nr:helix-turn-helix transcriptional regulator [Bacteroidales bacterium]